MRQTRLLVVALACAPAFAGFGCEDAPDLDQACRELQPGHTCTWVGSRAEEGWNGDGHHRVETLINQPQDLLFLPDGTAWFTDFNNFLIRRIHPDGTIESMVGSTDPLFPGDGPFEGVPPGGAEGSTWLLNHPTNLLRHLDGSVLVVAWHNHKLLSVDPESGFVKVLCGGGAGFAGDGAAVGPATLFRQVNDATLDEAGNIYVLDQQNGRIRMIDNEWIITTIAGDGMVGHSGDGGPALAAQFSWQRGSNPNPSGGLLYHAGKLYVADTEAHVIRVIDLASGIIDAFAGTGVAGDSGDEGPPLSAELRGPRDLEIGPDGDLYFADTDNGKIRAIDLEAGVIRTVVGTGELGIEAREGMPASETLLRRPFGIAFDPEGDLYVMDTLNSRIVKVAL